MKTLTVISRDISSVMSLDEAKEWLRVVGTDEDALITALLKGAVSYAENYLNKTIGKNSYVINMSELSGEVFLLRPPVISVSRIEYLDTDGVSQDFDLNLTGLNATEGVLYLKAGETWPSVASQPYSIKIHYDSEGLYEALDADDILDAVKMVLTYHYDYRDDSNQRWKKASDMILSPLRIIPFE